MTHKLSIPQHVVQMVTERIGRAHPFDVIDPKKTALLVVDMQNYFMHPDYQAVPMAREIVPNVNRLAGIVRAAGGHVVWLKTATDDTRASWSNYHEHLMSRDYAAWRYASMDTGHEGHALWPKLEAEAEDAQIVKKRFSAFIQGSSAIEAHLKRRGIDTLLIAGTTTNVCCESTARDAMMLNYKVVMVHDALAAYTEAEHNATLATFYMIFGDVQSIDEVAASMQRGGAPAAVAS
jgi:ureidoacrylate peracid hydrolase